MMSAAREEARGLCRQRQNTPLARSAQRCEVPACRTAGDARQCGEEVDERLNDVFSRQTRAVQSLRSGVRGRQACFLHRRRWRGAFFWRAEHVTVYYREPRATVVSIIAPCFEYDVVVLHAEGANAGEEAISNLYAKIDRVLFSRQRPWHPVLVLGDFNARDGSVESRHAGGHQRDRECKAGARSHLQAHCMCACMPDSLA